VRVEGDRIIAENSRRALKADLGYLVPHELIVQVIDEQPYHRVRDVVSNVAGASSELPKWLQVLVENDCLYHKREIWDQLGISHVPPIPEALISEAHLKGGRVSLRGSSIGAMLKGLSQAGFDRFK